MNTIQCLGFFTYNEILEPDVKLVSRNNLKDFAEGPNNNGRCSSIFLCSGSAIFQLGCNKIFYVSEICIYTVYIASHAVHVHHQIYRTTEFSESVDVPAVNRESTIRQQ